MAGPTKGEKVDAKVIIGKTVVGKSGKKIGVVSDLVYEVRTGELVFLSIKMPSAYAKSFQFEKDDNGNDEIPFNSIVSIGDFVVVAEEDII
jgi:sporulation protein YlmC with PRC-barrel domain